MSNAIIDRYEFYSSNTLNDGVEFSGLTIHEKTDYPAKKGGR